MKFAIFAAALAFAAPAVYAQVPGLPDCASPCIFSNLDKSGCDSGNFKCVCSSQSFLRAAAACIQGACPPDQLTAAMQAASKLCLGFGVTIPVSPPVETHTSTTDKITTTPPAPMTTSAPVTVVTTTSTEVRTVVSTYPTTSTEVTTVVSTYPTTKNPYPGTPCPTESPTTLITTTVSGTGSMTPTRNSSTPTVAPPPTNSEGAAVKNIASLGVMAIAVVGLFAF